MHTQRRDILDKLRKLGKLGKLKIQVLKQYAKQLGVNVLEVRGRKALELALNNLLSMGVQSYNVGYKDNAVENVEKSESAKQSMVCNIENTSVQELANDPCISDTLALKNLSLGHSNGTIAPKPGIIVAKDMQDKALFSKEFTINFITQVKYCLNKQLNHGLHVVGHVTLPNGIEYDRIHNVGGGDCFFISVSQGCKFFGINIDHIELRSRVGQWIQGHALLMETQLGIQPIDLLHLMTWFSAPPQGWWSYLINMDWVQWGVHVEQLGEWVGPLEVNPTNHVLEEMGSDLRVNIYSPDSQYIVGNEANVREDGHEKPIIFIMSSGGHYEWLRMKTG